MSCEAGGFSLGVVGTGMICGGSHDALAEGCRDFDYLSGETVAAQSLRRQARGHVNTFCVTTVVLYEYVRSTPKIYHTSCPDRSAKAPIFSHQMLLFLPRWCCDWSRRPTLR